jgi:hypothetical protein
VCGELLLLRINDPNLVITAGCLLNLDVEAGEKDEAERLNDLDDIVLLVDLLLVYLDNFRAPIIAWLIVKRLLLLMHLVLARLRKR